MGRRFRAKNKAEKVKLKAHNRVNKLKSEYKCNRIQKAAKYIRNLSDITLCDAEITALGKGLKFIPFSKVKINDIMRDFKITERNMRLRVLLANTKQKEVTAFKKKSSFSPLTSGSNNLENYLFATKLELAKLKFGKRHNLSKSEAIALKTLKCNKDIVIRKADKGNTIVILNRDDYITEGHKQLHNGIHYEKIEKIDLERTYIEVRNHVSYMYLHKEIDKNTHDYLYDTTNKSKTSYIYFLPKLHEIKHGSFKKGQEYCD